MTRIVITGIGAVSPLANNTNDTFNALIEGKSGIDHIKSFDSTNLDVKIAGEVKGFEYNSPNARKMDSFVKYGMVATEEALSQAGWKPTDEYSLSRTGVVVGSGIGGLVCMEKEIIAGYAKGPNRISPMFIPKSLINIGSGWISMEYGFTGPNHSVVTACATGAHALYTGAQMIQAGDADVMICGGCEGAICVSGIAGFSNMKALSKKRNDNPQSASRPWDKDRDGFVMGEGAGIFVIESLEHAQKRGATILAEFAGAGLSGDAHHLTSPEPGGRGARLAMQAALKKAQISEVDYINAHGTSTPVGDMIELKAAETVFSPDQSNKITMSSTKSATGHLLGAAGALEGVISVKVLETGVIPPTLNLDNPSEGSENFNLVPFTAQEKKVNTVLSNSFGFGGTNISLILKKFQ